MKKSEFCDTNWAFSHGKNDGWCFRAAFIRMLLKLILLTRNTMNTYNRRQRCSNVSYQNMAHNHSNSLKCSRKAASIYEVRFFSTFLSLPCQIFCMKEFLSYWLSKINAVSLILTLSTPLGQVLSRFTSFPFWQKTFLTHVCMTPPIKDLVRIA